MDESELLNVRALLGGGDLKGARRGCERLMKTAPSDWRVLCLAAELELRSSRPGEAIDFLRQATQFVPSDAAALIGLGHTLLRLGQRPGALELALRAQVQIGPEARLHDALGTLLTHLEEPVRGLPHFQHAIRGAPANIDFRYNLAMAQRMTGDFDGAESNLDVVIAARPADAGAFHARSGLRKQTAQRNHVTELEAALNRLNGRPGSIPVGFALAKELEDLGEFARSFAYLEAANRAHRASLQYEAQGDIAVLEKLRKTHTSDALEKLRTHNGSDECIFIIGLPRSGTTLIERILGNHSHVFAAGEIDAFPRAVIEAVTRCAGRFVNKFEFVDAVLKTDFERIGPAYIDATRPRTASRPKFTDKLPLNYLYAGLIHGALPGARIVAVRRAPMDTCYALFKTLFANACPFSYDLGELGRYYASWERLMDHWERVIGERWLNVKYEDLVTAQEPVSRRLIAHCGLDWEPGCMDFHRQSDAVTTASAVQVRRPIYADSVGKWRHYAAQLEPLARSLETHGVQIR